MARQAWCAGFALIHACLPESEHKHKVHFVGRSAFGRRLLCVSRHSRERY